VIAHNISKPIAVTDVMFKKGSGAIKLPVILRWLLRGSGPLTTPGCDHGAFVKTQSTLDQPDLQVKRSENNEGLYRPCDFPSCRHATMGTYLLY